MSNEYTVRARSLNVAMKRAKQIFGSNAIVVDTRDVVRKLPGELTVQPMVELVVTPVVPVNEDRLHTARDADYEIVRPGAATIPGIRRIQSEIERIERLIDSVEHASVRLRALDPGYPLFDALLTAGVSSDGIRSIQAAFERDHGGTGGLQAARDHLRGRLACAEVRDCKSISGVHVFLGAAGCGKSSLVIRLATEMVRSGRRPVIVAAAPYHRGEVRRLEEAASTLMIDVAVVTAWDELERVLKLHADADAVLVDTPCVLSRGRCEARQLLDHIGQSEVFFKHFIISMTDDIDFVLGELDLFRRWRCDYIALSRIDLARRCGRIVDVITHESAKFSFLSWVGDGAGVTLATTALLAGLISPELAEGTATARDEVTA